MATAFTTSPWAYNGKLFCLSEEGQTFVIGTGEEGFGFLFGAVMSVLGGIGAFSFHIWRHGRMPLEPHQEITDEDLEKYE